MAGREYFVELAKKLDAAPHGMKTKLIEDAAKIVGSVPSVWRGLKDIGWSSGRKTRSDCGDIELTEAQVMLLANHLWQSNRDNGKQLLSTHQAITDLVLSGHIPKISVATALRSMKMYGIHPKQLATPAPVQELASKYPNHVHQLDPSVALLFHLDKGTQSLEWHSAAEYYKNKPENFQKLREILWRYVLTDHTSGYISVHYIVAPGESFAAFFEAMLYFWGYKDHSPFRGVPEILITDNTSAVKTNEFKSFCKNLEIQHLPHLPGNPRAKGQVEGANNIIERSFEYKLKTTPVSSVDELNKLAQQWEQWFNSTVKHKRHGQPRLAVWQHIKEIRSLPARPICLMLAEPKPIIRQVSSKMMITLTLKGHDEVMEYSLVGIPNVNVDDKLEVRIPPYKLPNILVTVKDRQGKETQHELTRIERSTWGFTETSPVIGEEYKALPQTEREERKKTMNKQAFGVETTLEANKARKQHQPVFQGKVDVLKSMEMPANVAFLPRPEKPAVPVAPLMPRVKHLEAMTRLVKQLKRPLTPAEGEQMRRDYPDGLTDTDIANLVLAFAQPKLRAVGGSNA